MAAGRKSAPASLKVLNGRSEGRDSGGRPIKQPPAFGREVPVKPAGLSGDAEWLWDLVVSELERLDVLKRLDAASLRVGCEAYARWAEARRLRSERGILADTSQGVGVAPWVRVEESASRDFRSWCAEFGLTPAAEMKLATEASDGGGEENPFAGALG